MYQISELNKAYYLMLYWEPLNFMDPAVNV